MRGGFIGIPVIDPFIALFGTTSASFPCVKIQDMTYYGPGRVPVTPFSTGAEYIGRLRRTPIETRLRKPDLFVSDLRRAPRPFERGYGRFVQALTRRIDPSQSRISHESNALRFRFPIRHHIHRDFHHRFHHHFHPLRRLVRRFIIHEIRTGKNIPPEITRLLLNPVSLRGPVRFMERRVLETRELRPIEPFRPGLIDEEIRQFLEDPFSTVNESQLRTERNELVSEVEQLKNERQDLLIDLGDLREAVYEAMGQLAQTRGMINNERYFNQPVLYAIAPVGRPTPLAPSSHSPQVNIQINIQQRQAGPHGGMVDILA